MKRRSFLQLLGLSPAIGAAAVVPEPVPLPKAIDKVLKLPDPKPCKIPYADLAGEFPIPHPENVLVDVPFFTDTETAKTDASETSGNDC